MKQLAVLLSMMLVFGTIFAAEQNGNIAADGVASEQPTEQTDAPDLTEVNPEPEQDSDLAAIDANTDGQGDEEDKGSNRFIPSERISEDLGISFPVDI